MQTEYTERDMPSNTHTQTNMDHLDELSFLQHAGLGMLLSQHTVKDQPQILFLLFLLFFAFQPIFVLCYSHTNVIIRTLNKLCNLSRPLPISGCVVLFEIKLQI